MNNTQVPAYITLKKNSYCARGHTSKCQENKTLMLAGTGAFWLTSPSKQTICFGCGDPEWKGPGSNYAQRKEVAIEKMKDVGKPTLGKSQIRQDILHFMICRLESNFSELIQWAPHNHISALEAKEAIDFLHSKKLVALNEYMSYRPGAPFYVITPLGNHYDLILDKNIFPDYTPGHPILAYEG